jgi:hypothetical protein
MTGIFQAQRSVLMGEMKFADNYSDLSRESGVDAGFQFEFYCERCNDTWRTPFTPYRSGQASGWLGKISSAFGGMLGTVGDTMDGLAQAGWGKARDQVFKEAVQQAKSHFHRCGRCFQYVCDSCWNIDSGLCMNCAPSVEAEIEAARTQGMIFGAAENAANEGIRRGKQMDVGRKRQMVCPECGEPTSGAKFCPSCGCRLSAPSKCSGCGAELTPKTKFCPECGRKA